jgi:hypothetical protein
MAVGRSGTMTGEKLFDDASVKVGAKRGHHSRPPRRGSGPSADGGAVYGLGMIGALVFFLRTAQTDRERLLAFPMAMVWPALLVYRLFRFLGA